MRRLTKHNDTVLQFGIDGARRHFGQDGEQVLKEELAVIDLCGMLDRIDQGGLEASAVS